MKMKMSVDTKYYRICGERLHNRVAFVERFRFGLCGFIYIYIDGMAWYDLLTLWTCFAFIFFDPSLLQSIS